MRASTSPQATCVSVLTVTPARRARSRMAALSAAGSSRSTASGSSGGRELGSPATRVGRSTPASAARQASVAAAPSWRRSQAR
jgi:hypothetical protein